VDEARRGYARGAQAVEVIVADNGSSDRTGAIAAGRGCRVVRVPLRSIAAARNAGARLAASPWLAFVDADSRVHPDTFDAIDRALSRHDVAIGATGVRMDRMSPGIAATLAVVETVNRLRAIDTGVVFCRRADWLAVGGYPEHRRFGEDLAFMLAVKALGRTRGQRFVRPAGVRAVTSARKYDRFGDWHVFASTLRACAWWLTDRAALDRFVERYWYERRG
jgi:glycosyltransferase involved in cell wall biosynthesis